MKKYIIADRDRLELKTWNKAYGNNILHLLFVLRVAVEYGIEPVVPCSSVLDDIFNIEPLKKELTGLTQYNYIEKSAYINFKILDIISSRIKKNLQFKGQSLKSVVNRSKKQYESELKFLKNMKSKDNIFSVKGHFWHFNLMPSKIVFDKYMPIKTELITAINTKYPDITAKNSVAVHLRETDLKRHLTHIYQDMVLDDGYYLSAIKKVEELLGVNVSYHLYSDNVDRLKNIFKNKKIIVHNDSAPEDWVALFLSKNVIQSNSTFCWTASLYKTGINIQPKNGRNYHSDLGPVPYGFKMNNAITINRELN